jgi:thioesterase domain-containing protein
VTATERRLERIWSAVLRLDGVGRDESFTALGGDSLAVEEMLTRVHDELGPSLTAADLAEHATLDLFADLVDRSARHGRPRRANELIRLRPEGSRPPVFCFAGAGGAGAFFEAFAAGLGPDRGVYALQAHGFDEPGIPDWTVGRAARRHLRALEEVAPSGPVALVGHSFGGLLALRVAQLLCRRGRQVPLLTVLDTFLPAAAQPADRPPQTVPADPAAETGEGLWRTRVRLLGAGLVRYAPAVQQDVFHEQGARVARFHRPRPWPGAALVFMSDENPDDPGWWRTVLTGDLQVRRVRTDHLGLLRPPYVGEVTEPVREALEARERPWTEGPAVSGPQA